MSREAENDIGANAAIARMQAAKGAQADLKGAMQQVKDPNRRSRTYKPYLDRNVPFYECPLLALSGHHARRLQCPLLGVKRTFIAPSSLLI